MNRRWLEMSWPAVPAAVKQPAAFLSLACLGDMRVKPQPELYVFEELDRIFPGRRFVWLCQEHTKIVRKADAGDTVTGLVGDGLVTNDSRTLIGITVADCMPVFLWDTASGARALLHSGWKGTGIVCEALNLMKTSYGSFPENIRALLGPSIRSCCYAVPEERAKAFAAGFGENTVSFRDGAWYIDLAAANANILKAEGVTRIQTYPACTCCDSSFSSCRRQGKNFTRMLALCG